MKTIIVPVIAVYIVFVIILNRYCQKRSEIEKPDYKSNTTTECDLEPGETENVTVNCKKVLPHQKVNNNFIATPDMLDFVKNVKTSTETMYVLSQNNSAKIQYALAKLRILEVQKCLLKYPYLKARALIEICEKPANFDFNSHEIQTYFNHAIQKARLKPEHEVRIAKCKNPVIKMALLMRPQLSYKGFLEICKNPKGIDMNSKSVEICFRNTTKKLVPTLDEYEKFELAKTKIKWILESLI